MRATRGRTGKGFPKPLRIFVIGFIAVWAVVFVSLGVKFVSGIVNENSNSHQIEIMVDKKEIVASRSDDSTFTEFVITATVYENGTSHGELLAIRGSARDVSNIYANLREGERYVVQVNGDPDKYRVITGIIG